MEFRMRNRARLRRKEVEDLAQRLTSELGLATVFGPDEPLEVGEGPDRRYLLLKNEIIGFYEGEAPFLSPKGLLRWPATKRFVTVDMGAVRFVTNGADVMGPGITDADPGIKAGDLVWIREERHGKPLGVGQSLAEAPVLKAKTKGKQVKALLHVGDKAWTFGQEEEKSATADAPAED